MSVLSVYFQHRIYAWIGCILAIIAFICIVYVILSKNRKYEKIAWIGTVALTLVTGVCFHLDTPYEQYMNYRKFAIESMNRNSRDLDVLKNKTKLFYTKKGYLIDNIRFYRYYKIDKYLFTNIVSEIKNENELLNEIGFTSFKEKQQDSYVKYSIDLQRELGTLNDFRRDSEKSREIIKKNKLNSSRYLYFTPYYYNKFLIHIKILNNIFSNEYDDLQSNYYLKSTKIDSTVSQNYEKKQFYKDNIFDPNMFK